MNTAPTPHPAGMDLLLTRRSMSCSSVEALMGWMVMDMFETRYATDAARTADVFAVFATKPRIQGVHSPDTAYCSDGTSNGSHPRAGWASG